MVQWEKLNVHLYYIVTCVWHPSREFVCVCVCGVLQFWNCVLFASQRYEIDFCIANESKCNEFQAAMAQFQFVYTLAGAN